MSQHPAQRAGVPLSTTAASSTHDPDDPAWGAWQRHVAAGRIGTRASYSVEQRIRMMRKEITMFGRVVTRELERF